MVEAVNLSMQVNLIISARNLKRLDIMSRSDPQCNVYEWRHDGKWKKIGKTEKLNNNQNPDWETAIQVPYFFEKVQKLRFKIEDDDDNDDDIIGEIYTTMGNLMGARAQTYTEDLQFNGAPAERGTFIIRT